MQAAGFSGIARLLVALAVTFPSVAGWSATAEVATYATPPVLPLIATYDKGTSFFHTSNSTLGSCSNANCNFETVTQIWGGATFTALATSRFILDDN